MEDTKTDNPGLLLKASQSPSRKLLKRLTTMQTLPKKPENTEIYGQSASTNLKLIDVECSSPKQIPTDLPSSITSYVLFGKGLQGKNQSNIGDSSPWKSKMSSDFTGFGHHSQISGQVAVEEERSFQPPPLKYTKTMGTRDKAKRDIIAYINEKKARKEVTENSPSHLIHHSLHLGSFAHQTKTKNNTRHILDNILEHAVNDEEYDGIEGRTDGPVISYTNDPYYKKKARQDILEYVREKNNRKRPTELKEAFGFSATIDKLMIEDKDLTQEQLMPPPIKYTNTYNSKRKAREDILAFMAEKKALEKVNEGSPKSPAVHGFNPPFLNSNKTVKPIRRKIGDYGKSKTYEKNGSSQFKPVQPIDLRDQRLRAIQPPNDISLLVKGEWTPKINANHSISIATLEKSHEIGAISPSRRNILPPISPSHNKSIDFQRRMQKIIRTKTLGSNYLTLGNTTESYLDNRQGNAGQQMDTPLKKNCIEPLGSADKSPMHGSNEKRAKLMRQVSLNLSPKNLQRRYFRQNTSFIETAALKYHDQVPIPNNQLEKSVDFHTKALDSHVLSGFHPKLATLGAEEQTTVQLGADKPASSESKKAEKKLPSREKSQPKNNIVRRTRVLPSGSELLHHSLH